MTAWWLAFRYFGNWRRFFNLSTSLSVIGMTIGVSSLIVSMAVFSGYVSTLEKTVQDAVGHLLVSKRGAADQTQMLNDIKPLLPDLVAATPYVSAQAILADKGKISGVSLEGVDESTVRDVLNLDARVIEGTSHLSDGEPETDDDGDPVTRTLIGKGIAQKFDLKIGDVYRMVVPLSTEFQSSNFKPKLGKFKVAGIVNFGRYDFDTRFVVLPLAAAQSFLEIGDHITGYRLRLSDPYRARAAAMAITEKFKNAYWARDWLEVNRYLFEAARLEKTVLFFILMILVVAAAFNIANTLFISVVQRYHDISVLKTLGATDGLVRRVFVAQGLIVGGVGALSGIVLGLLLCRLVEWVQVAYKIIPADVYKLDHIDLQVRFGDVASIVAAVIVVCLVATWVPSRRGAKISPVEGLRYE